MALKPPPKNHKHVPQLSPEKLQSALDRLQAASISSEGKREISQILQAAANPVSQSPENQIRQMEPERQEVIKKATKKLATLNASLEKRGRDGLMAMSEAEFRRLVDEANEQSS
jgi:hypothetical protein